LAAESITLESDSTPRAKSGSVPGYAFITPWAFGSLGGVSGVLRSLVSQIAGSGRVCPLVFEHGDTGVKKIGKGDSLHFKVGLRSPFDSARPWRSFLGFCYRLPGILWQMRGLCSRHKIQVINPHFVALEHLPFLLLKKLGWFKGRLILSFHGADIRSMLQSRGMERWLNRILLMGADWLVPCSEGLSEEVLMLVPERQDSVVAIQNGIDIERFLSGADAQFRPQPQFRGRTIILNVGAFEYKKAHDVLLKAYRLVLSHHPDTCLVIAGQRSSKATAQLAEEMGLSDHVVFLESLPHPQIVSLLEMCEVFVLSSRWEKGICGEGMALALLEAAAVSKPVVSTRSCGVTELITDGDTGLVVPTEDPSALATAISDMLDHPDTARKMAERLHDRVRRQFTWRRAADRYLELGLIQ